MSSIAPAAHHEESRLSINRLGLWLFIVSETFLFAALVSARYYSLGLYRPPELNQLLGLGITCVLLLSSLTAYRAEAFAKHGNQKAFLQNTLWTILLGVAFLFGVGYEWSEALTHFPPSTKFGTAFFSLTGMHALHVLSGVALLALLHNIGRKRQFSGTDYWPVEGVVKYWHFVDVVWVVVYPTLYLVA